jgi:hypothetical protein
LQGSAALAPVGPGGSLAARPFGRVTVSALGSVPRRPLAPAAVTLLPFEMSWGKLNALYAY